MLHTVFTRFKFDDKELMKKYLDVTKKFLIPSLISQTYKNFKWLVMTYDDDIEFLKDELNFDFTPIKDFDHYFNYVKDNNISIQTRHDCDDTMSKDYIQKIQDTYNENKELYDTFLIQSQPSKLLYGKGNTTRWINFKVAPFHNKRTSMHLSLCQKNINYSIFDRGHGQMWQLTDNIIDIGDGYTEWVLHGENISSKSAGYQRRIKKINGN